MATIPIILPSFYVFRGWETTGERIMIRALNFDGTKRSIASIEHFIRPMGAAVIVDHLTRTLNVYYRGEHLVCEFGGYVCTFKDELRVYTEIAFNASFDLQAASVSDVFSSQVQAYKAYPVREIVLNYATPEDPDGDVEFKWRM